MTGPELDATAGTYTLFALKAVLATAVGVECRRTVRADNAQILKAVIVSHPVDVIEDEGHPPAQPHLALTAELTFARLEAILEKALLEVPRE